MLICSRCEKEKQESEFSYDSKRQKYSSQCRECRASHLREVARQRKKLYKYKISADYDPLPDSIPIERLKRMVQVGDRISEEHHYLGDTYCVWKRVIDVLGFGILTVDEYGNKESYHWSEVLAAINKKQYKFAQEV